MLKRTLKKKKKKVSSTELMPERGEQARESSKQREVQVQRP